MPTVTKQNRAQVNCKPITTDNDDAWQMIDRITLLLYGRSGTGKTRFWGTFPGRTLALVCSGSKKPGELRSIDTPENRGRITAKIVRNMESINGLIEGADEYDNVVLDHISGFQDLNLKEILGLDVLPIKRDWGLLTGDHYKQSNRQVVEVVRTLLNLRGSVVIVGQERVFTGKGDDTESSIIQPSVSADTTPGVGLWLAPACDYVCGTYIRAKTRLMQTEKDGPQISVREKGVEYCLRVEPNDVYATKFRRVGNSPLVDIVDPNHTKFMAMVRGEVQVKKTVKA